jgi:hypothetical protein
MTKTSARIAARRDINSGFRCAQWQPDPLFGFLNLGHWDLFGIWYLVLGIFMIFKLVL